MLEFQTPPKLFSNRFLKISFVVILLTGLLLYLSGSFKPEPKVPGVEEIMDSIETVKPTDV